MRRRLAAAEYPINAPANAAPGRAVPCQHGADERIRGPITGLFGASIDGAIAPGGSGGHCARSGSDCPSYCMRILETYPGRTSAKLARHTHVTAQAMNQVLQGLQDLGVVSRPATAP